MNPCVPARSWRAPISEASPGAQKQAELAAAKKAAAELAARMAELEQALAEKMRGAGGATASAPRPHPLPLLAAIAGLIRAHAALRLRLIPVSEADTG